MSTKHGKQACYIQLEVHLTFYVLSHCACVTFCCSNHDLVGFRVGFNAGEFDEAAAGGCEEAALPLGSAGQFRPVQEDSAAPKVPVWQTVMLAAICKALTGLTCTLTFATNTMQANVCTVTSVVTCLVCLLLLQRSTR